MPLPILLRSLLLGCFLTLAACSGGSDGDGDGDNGTPRVCQTATTQACTCTDGAQGAQTCAQDTWGSCVCDGTPVCQTGATQGCVCTNGASGSQTCSSEQWGTCACADPPPTNKTHGDLCTAPNFDCGTDSQLTCVVDSQGDEQGICRVACQNNLSCTGNDQSWDAGDTHCCDVENGTSACFAPFVCN